MPTPVRALLLLVAWLVPAADAMAVELPAKATLGIYIPTLPAFEAQAFGGVQVNPNGSGNHLFSLSIADGFASRATTLAVTDPAVAPIKGLRITATNAFGFLAEDANGILEGAMPIRGTTKVCLFGTCGTAVANVTVPLSVIGNGGTAVAQGAVNVTVRGAPWTTGTIQVGTYTTAGSRMGRHGAVRSTTAQLGGRLNLVTPIYISTNIAAIPRIDATGRLELRFDGVGSCDVETDQTGYFAGDTVTLTRLQFSNQRVLTRDYRMQIYVQAPIPEIRVQILDQIVRLGPEFSRDIAPVVVLPFVTDQPRGEYRFGCSLTDAITGEQHGDEAAFELF